MKKYRGKFEDNYLRKLSNEIIRRDHLKTTATEIRFMERRDLLNFIAEHGHEEMPDQLNPISIFSLIPNDLLCAAVNGEINLLDLAKETLTNRGYNSNNVWIGFKTGKRIMK